MHLTETFNNQVLVFGENLGKAIGSKADISVSFTQIFGLGFGPIPKLSLLLENNGVLVGHAPLSEGMDGVSAWFNERPFILVSSHANYFRNRLDVGHELGHLVLHRGLTQDDIDQKDFLKLS